MMGKLVLALSSAGLWLAVPLTGRAALMTFGNCEESLSKLNSLSRWALISVVGIAVWSVPMLMLSLWDLFSTVWVGLTGWAISVLFLVRRAKRSRALSPRPAEAGGKRWVILLPVVALGALATLNLFFPTDSIRGGGDSGTYANYAIHLARTGQSRLAYPQYGFGVEVPDVVYQGFPGFFKTPGAQTVQLPRLFSLWLAQAFSTFGFLGLYRLAPLLALLSLSLIYGIGEEWLGPKVGLSVTVLAGISAPEIFCSRTTLTEVFAQMLVWGGLLALGIGLRSHATALACWGAGLLGASFFVRIDMLLLPPLLLAADLLLRLFNGGGDENKKTWFAIHVLAFALWLASVGYYAHCNGPYFMDLLPELERIALFYMVVVLVAVAVRPKVLRLIRPAAVSPITLWAAMVLLLALAIYAYWIRPHTGHPAIAGNMFGWYRGRDFRELALANLGGYLSPVLVMAGVAGLGLFFLNVARGRAERPWATVAIVGFAFTGLYAWNPYITPLQVYASRRYVPITIPAITIFAGYFLVKAVEKFHRRARVWSLVSFIVGVFAFEAYASYPMLFLADSNGYTKQCAEIAARLPNGALVLAWGDLYGAGQWTTPLAIAFDKKIVPLHARNHEEQLLMYGFIKGLLSRGTPLYCVTENRLAGVGVSTTQVASYNLSWRSLEQTIDPPRPPRLVLTESINLYVARVEDAEPLTGYDSLVPGGQEILGVSEVGFYSTSSGPEEHPQRWTNGNATLWFPLKAGVQANFLDVQIINTAPSGTDLAIFANGLMLFSGHVGPGPSSAHLDLSRVPVGRELEVSLKSGTFVPKNVIPGSQDPRSLGVLVGWVRPTFRGQPLSSSDSVSPLYRSFIAPIGHLDKLTVHKGLKFPVTFEVCNKGSQPWSPYSKGGSIRLGFLWYRASEAAVLLSEQRADFAEAVAPGQCTQVNAMLEAANKDGSPLTPGTYAIRVGLLEENVTWFYQKGDAAIWLNVEVIQ